MVRVPLTPDEVRRGQEIGALLREARGARTLMDVAVGAGISPETLRKIETGRIATPAFFTIMALCDALGTTADELAASTAAERPMTG